MTAVRNKSHHRKTVVKLPAVTVSKIATAVDTLAVQDEGGSAKPAEAARAISPTQPPIRLKKAPRSAKVRAVLEDLLRSGPEGPHLEDYLPSLVAAKKTAEALRLLEYVQEHDPQDVLDMDPWKAALYAALGRYEDAEDLLRGYGNKAASRFYEASKFLEGAHPQATLWLAQQAVDLGSNDMQTLLHLANVQASMELCAAALNTLARLAELGPLGPQGLMLRAFCHLRPGRWEKARADVEALVRDCPEVGEFQAMLAALDAEAGNLEAARKRCNDIGTTWLKTLAGVRYFIHAACLVNDTHLMTLAAVHASASGYNEGDGYAELVNAQAHSGSLNAATSVARVATRMLPDHANTHRMLGEILDARGLHAEAALAYTEAIACGEPDVALHLLHAEALLAAGSHKAAGSAFKQVCKQSPGCMQALRGVIAVLQASEAPARERVEWLHRAHVQQPDDIGLAAMFVTAADALPNPVYRQRTRAALERLHEQSPDAPQWRTLLAKALRTTDPERALGLAESALVVEPQNADAQAVAKAMREELRAQQNKRAFTLTAIPLADKSTDARAPSLVTFTAGNRTVTGVELGKTHENRTVVRTVDGTLHWAPWTVCGSGQPTGAVAALKAGAAYAVPEGIAQRFAEVLATPVVNEATVADFCRVLGKRGEVFLSGGAVRDIIADPHNAEPRDVDVTSTLAPSLVRLSCGTLAGGAKGIKNRPDGVVSPYHLEFFGLVKFGRVQSRDGDAEGEGVVQATLDVMSMRTYGALEPLREVQGARQPVKPVAFGPDLHADALFRDFTCNALYYDPLTRMLLDPTGYGKVDATLRRLQLCSQEHIHKNESLGWRYIKMRQLGYSATERTREALRAHFAHYMSQPDSATWLQRSLTRVFVELGPKAHGVDNTAARKRWYASALHILKMDAIGDEALYQAMRL